MESYRKPEMSLVSFHRIDVLTASAGDDNSTSTEPTTKSYDLPYIPIP